jgi:hypothetical protein
MIRCRPQYLPKELSSIFFVAVHLPSKTDAGTKTSLNELYLAICKEENAQPDAALLVARDFTANPFLHTLPFKSSGSLRNVLVFERKAH